MSELDALSATLRGDLIALVGTTTRVLDDCRMPNGALVEAPSHIPVYPAAARDCLSCRPGRDLPLAILAMDALGRDLRAPLLRWLHDRAEGFRDDGIVRHRFSVNGRLLDGRPDPRGTDLLRLAGESAAVAASSGAEFEDRLTAVANDEPDTVWAGFLRVAVRAMRGEIDEARSSFFAAIDAADRDGHFPERLEPNSPRPYLAGHLAFLLAAHHTGELVRIPKSGYTGRRRA